MLLADTLRRFDPSANINSFDPLTERVRGMGGDSLFCDF